MYLSGKYFLVIGKNRRHVLTLEVIKNTLKKNSKGQKYSQKGTKIQKILGNYRFSKNYSTCIISCIMAE